MTTRKKWATAFPLIPPMTKTKHPSEPTVYRYLKQQAGLWERGALRSWAVSIYVDEGTGSGWELYERVDLRKVAQ